MALNANQRKAKSRQENRDRGLVRLYIAEVWVTPEQAKILQQEIAVLIAKNIGR